MKNVLLGVTGSIAAYKALEIIRELKKKGKNVKVMLTDEAKEFVSPLSFSTLSEEKVSSDPFEERELATHIGLAKYELILIAPATYNIIGKIACGIADDLISLAVSATRSPVIISPAMNKNMWNNPILKNNIKKLKQLGYRFIEPEKGALASLKEGEGEGRLASTAKIVNEVIRILDSKSDLVGKKILITAGRTCEDIDPIRFISNRSSGRMGYFLAEDAEIRGAEVTLISGPSELVPPANILTLNVRRANEMKNEVLSRINDIDIIIMAAAVADYTPKKYLSKKIKKDADEINLILKKTSDIVSLIKKKRKNIFVVGFSIDTEHPIENAKRKLIDKNMDLIIANPPTSAGSEDTQITFIDKDLSVEKLPTMSKKEVVTRIMDKIKSLYERNLKA